MAKTLQIRLDVEAEIIWTHFCKHKDFKHLNSLGVLNSLMCSFLNEESIHEVSKKYGLQVKRQKFLVEKVCLPDGAVKQEYAHLFKREANGVYWIMSRSELDSCLQGRLVFEWIPFGKIPKTETTNQDPELAALLA